MVFVFEKTPTLCFRTFDVISVRSMIIMPHGYKIMKTFNSLLWIFKLSLDADTLVFNRASFSANL